MLVYNIIAGVFFIADLVTLGGLMSGVFNIWVVAITYFLTGGYMLLYREVKLSKV